MPYIFQTQQNSALSNLILKWAINKNKQPPNAFLPSYAVTAAADPKGQQAGEMVGSAPTSGGSQQHVTTAPPFPNLRGHSGHKHIIFQKKKKVLSDSH